jgi:hypothetical protein
MNKFRNIEYFVKEFTLQSGGRRYQPWVKFKEKGMLWGWNKYETPIFIATGQFYEFNLLLQMFEIGCSFDYFDTELEAKIYIDKYNEWYLNESKKQHDNQIIDSKII